MSNNYGYDVIRESDLEVLINKVNIVMANGWKCQGGIFACFSSSGNVISYYQAICRDTQQ
jgi:hypothetical protein